MKSFKSYSVLAIRLCAICLFVGIATLQIQAQCDGDAGTLETQLTASCDFEDITIIHNGDQFLEPEDVMQYVIHDGTSSDLGNVLGISSTPTFAYEVTYVPGESYATAAIVGNDDGTGNVDLGACFSMAAGPEIIFYEPIEIVCSPDIALSCFQTTVELACTTGGSGVYSYVWATGEISETIQVFMPGTYTVTVVDVVSGCQAEGLIVVFEDTNEPEINIDASESALSCEVTELDLTIEVLSMLPDVEFIWGQNGAVISTEQTITVTEAGVYCGTATDMVTGCESTTCYQVVFVDDGCGTIDGVVYRDGDFDCVMQSDDSLLPNQLVRAMSVTDTVYGYSDVDGHIEIFAPPGTYTIEALPNNTDFWAACPALDNVVLNPDQTSFIDFGLQPLVNCTDLNVDIGTPFLRRCFDNTYTVSYCNEGTTDATDVYVEVELPEFFFVEQSSLSFTIVDGIMTFEIGDLGVGQCGTITIIGELSCEADFGATYCATAQIFPNDPCVLSADWSGASLEILATCDVDEVKFEIINVGTGNMQTESSFIVIEDGVMLLSEPETFQLDVLESLELNYPANGSTYYINAMQVPNHPGNSMPSLVVEGCGTNADGAFSVGFVNAFPQNDSDGYISIDCDEAIGSYDPNDKRAYPRGYGDAHYIKENTELEYKIRFQNTGTDTAFTVRIEDALPPQLNIETLRTGASSHPYSVEILGADTLVFLFENIMLPDSNVNEVASHGFVKFKIEQQLDLPEGTTIENEAAIYFDFNEAVITNTAFHTIGDEFIETGTNTVAFPTLNLLIAPNPVTEQFKIDLEGVEFTNATLKITDINGRVIQEAHWSASSEIISMNKQAAGVYLYELVIDGVFARAGKIVKL